jgi:tetratricopeptide (TPR) repeat protein
MNIAKLLKPIKFSQPYIISNCQVLTVSLVLLITFFLSLVPLWSQEKTLVKVPQPPLDHLEGVVSKQLKEGREMVDRLIAKTSVKDEVRGNAYGQLGQLYHAYELWDAAKACYQNAVILNVDSFEWNYALAYLLQSQGGYTEALEIYKKLKPDEGDQEKRYLIFIRIGECYRSLNQPVEAGKTFNAAYQLNPNGPSVLARLGEVALDERDFKKAVNFLSQALEIRPDANQLHYPLGMAFRGIGDMGQARAHLSQYGMVGIQPPDELRKHLKTLITGYRVHLLAGHLAFNAKRYVEASESFKKAIDADPKKAAAQINLAATLVQLAKINEAVKWFKEAEKLEPKNVTIHFNLGTLYSHYGYHTLAIPHLQAVVAQNPEDAKAYLNLADTFNKDRQSDQAIKHYKIAVGLDPRLVSGWVQLNFLHTSRREYGEALKVMEEAHKKMPHDLTIAHALARQLSASPVLANRSGKRALQIAKKVFDASNHYESARTVAMAYGELNQCDKAVIWMQQAIQMATQAGQPDAVLNKLKENLYHFQNTKPCRVPTNY